MKKITLHYVFVFLSLFTTQAYSQYTLTIDDVEFENGIITDYINTTEKDIIIPSEFDGVQVTEIGFRAFYEKELTHISFPNTIITIESSAFTRNRLLNVTLPNSLTFLGFQSFAYNDLVSIAIPSSLIKIDDRAFMGNDISNINFEYGINIADGLPKIADYGNI